MTSTDVSPHGKSKFHVLSKGLPLQALYVKTTDLFNELSALRELTIYCWDKNVNKKCLKSNMCHYEKKKTKYITKRCLSVWFITVLLVSQIVPNTLSVAYKYT